MERARAGYAVAPDLFCVRILIANVCFIGHPGASPGRWMLVDAGLPLSRRLVWEAARDLYGRHSQPGAILLTHGHFDHVGALADLAEFWDVPVYAHPDELPYLTGREDYLPPDPSVGGGLMALLSPLYPRRAIDLGHRVRPLPPDGAVPGLPDWRWIHTPGHTPGHVSFFREADRALIAGDAFITVKQESALAVLTQTPTVQGPPAYFTPDWAQARASVERLHALRPAMAATGHGIPMEGELLTQGLERLVSQFDRLAIPEQGRYVPSQKA